LIAVFFAWAVVEMQMRAKRQNALLRLFLIISFIIKGLNWLIFV